MKKMVRSDIQRSISVCVFIVVCLLSLYILTLCLYPSVYDAVSGETNAREILDKIAPVNASAYDTAAAIATWQRDNINVPYEKNMPFGWTNVTGSWRPFIRSVPPLWYVPPSWYLYAKIGNCQELAESFVYLMHLRGYTARVDTVLGEDHSFPEFDYNGTTYAVEATWLGIVPNKTERANGSGWSYIESRNPYNKSDTRDVSDEYFPRGELQLTVLKGGIPEPNIQVVVFSRHLMQVDSSYKVPKLVLSNNTDTNGSVTFKLGIKQYLLQLHETHLIIDRSYEINATVVAGEDSRVTVELDNLSGKWGLWLG